MRNQNDELRQSYVRLLTALQVALPIISRNSNLTRTWLPLFDVVVEERAAIDDIILSDGVSEKEVESIIARQVQISQNNAPAPPTAVTPESAVPTTPRRKTKAKTSAS